MCIIKSPWSLKVCVEISVPWSDLLPTKRCRGRGNSSTNSTPKPWIWMSLRELQTFRVIIFCVPSAARKGITRRKWTHGHWNLLRGWLWEFGIFQYTLSQDGRLVAFDLSGAGLGDAQKSTQVYSQLLCNHAWDPDLWSERIKVLRFFPYVQKSWSHNPKAQFSRSIHRTIVLR